MNKLALVPLFAALAAHAVQEIPFAPTTRLQGPMERRLEAMVENGLKRTDPRYLALCFKERSESRWWQSEFWGKFMQSAVPLACMGKDGAFTGVVAASVKDVEASQLEDGYIGNYDASCRHGEGWDVWGAKYTMLGLLSWYDAKGDESALAACRKLCDCLIASVGPRARKKIASTGFFAGMPSCSVLEPVVMLYNRTKDGKYLAFADEIVRQMKEEKNGPRLFDLAFAGVPVADRSEPDRIGDRKTNRNKSYEMMSCYQGLLEYYLVTGKKECLDAAVATARDIVTNEINVAGGASAGEFWYDGAKRQHEPWHSQQETCVTITWMRLCAKLLSITGDPAWGDEMEKSFFNAYLASLSPDGSEFAMYTPLDGYRSGGRCHCQMHTNCCNANGARGFLEYLRTCLVKDSSGAAVMNHYVSSRSDVEIAGSVARFETHTLYPKLPRVNITYRSEKAMEFPLKLRIPAWSAKTAVSVNSARVPDVKPGEYLVVERTWKQGDKIEIDFDLAVKAHRLAHHVAFTRGPVLLARDSGFADGALDEALAPTKLKAMVDSFAPVRSERENGISQTVAARLYFATHTEGYDGALPGQVRFCDYASAAPGWNVNSHCRVWLPEAYRYWTDITHTLP